MGTVSNICFLIAFVGAIWTFVIEPLLPEQRVAPRHKRRARRSQMRRTLWRRSWR